MLAVKKLTRRLAPWWRTNSTIAEVMSALTLWYWGLLLLLPVSTFAASRSYSAMAALGSEEAWGVVMCAAAALQSIGVCGQRPIARVCGAYCALAIWGFAAAMFASSNIYTHAPGIYAILAAGQAYALLVRGPHRDGQ